MKTRQSYYTIKLHTEMCLRTNYVFKHRYILMFLILVILYCAFSILFIKYTVFTSLQPLLKLVKRMSNVDKNKTICPVLAINKKYVITADDNLCVPRQPSESGCDVAARIFKYNASRSCDVSSGVRICWFENNALRCSGKTCGKLYNDNITVFMFNYSTGSVQTFATNFTADEDITSFVSTYVQRTIKNGFHFLFVSCAGQENKTQLLVLDEHFPSKTSHPRKNQKVDKSLNNCLNINVVFFDSISRGHFYRSLQKTINSFNEINSVGDAEVLDFELFQALYGHTVPNIRALYLGKSLSNNMSKPEIENVPVVANDFHKHFKRLGYKTLYQEDLCWRSPWGLRFDLGSHANTAWSEFYKALNESYIDETGLTFASCKVLELFKLRHIFNTDENENICYNGKQQDSYFLDYIANKYRSLSSTDAHALFSYTALHIAHDSGGVRIQTIDQDLAKFVSLMSRMDNTLTVILADHGNTYTDYVYTNIEGRYEMFHPSLFMVVPKGVQQYIGDDVMTSLRLNQKRLLTMIDIHHTLYALTDKNYQKKGLLREISAKRNCSQLPLIQPNLCLCKKWRHPVQDLKDILGQLEFAVGKLNNMITNYSTHDQCKRLVPIHVENAYQQMHDSQLITTFDVHTEPGINSKNKHDVFNVQVSSQTISELNSFHMKLLAWDRVSQYGVYKTCNDMKSFNMLCVCDLPVDIENETFLNAENRTNIFYESRTSLGYTMAHYHETIIAIYKERVSLLTRIYKYKEDPTDEEHLIVSASFEVLNVPSVNNSNSFYISLNFTRLENMKFASAGKCEGVVPANKVIYICSVVSTWSLTDADYRVVLSFRMV
ncbi:uncharacterized protein LOC130654542 [Hydractinia symbiolongicarpus]|uniref:uncharacterized protein LOC130654542 n=1 Tax=Hydractinia symbiolongicarpus TaxID=13093 RepID=UPI002550FB62|nr:uncharacterized protein LOC130654542 [Hydractinia symbiolongicarpus]